MALSAGDAKARRQWNTSRLSERSAMDLVSAVVAGGSVAPLITVIDKAIIENASGGNSIMVSAKASLRTLLLRPHIFLSSRPFRLICAVYGGTYLTANTLDTAKSTMGNRPASRTTSGPSKFFATSAANLSMSMWKDSQFTQMFGAGTKSRPVPGPSFALFAVRDALTIFASFNLPPLLAPALPLSDAVQRQYFSRATAAQFLAPAAIQLLSTPLHLLGLDLYNRPRSGGGAACPSWSDRLRKVRLDWLPSSLARMCRIVPAFGVGGVINTNVRAKLMRRLED